MKKETTAYGGWARNLVLSNDHAELVVTLDVGPRIISYKRAGGANVFKNFEEEIGGSGEGEFVLRGGHRLWIAPEDLVRSYHPDNFPVDFHSDEFTGEIVIDSLQDRSGRIMKTIGVTLADNSSQVTVRHTLHNQGEETIQASSWALTVMEAGGVEIIPQPPLGEHPRDLLPNRKMVLWPYTDLSDPRWTFGRKFITLRQDEALPAKLGLAHAEKWIAYIVGDSLFVKTFAYIEGAVYPDGGSNFETFTNSSMLEIESLSPLATLRPGESVSHTEHWYVFPITSEITIDSEDSLAAWLSGFLDKIGV